MATYKLCIQYKFTLCLLLFSISIVGCEKQIDPYQLVVSLEKDSLFKTYDGYLITPRSGDVYYLAGPERFADYWIRYDSRGPAFMKKDLRYTHYQDSIRQVDSNTFNRKNEFYINKAYELITTIKQLGIRWVNSQGTFECSFNDSLRLRFYPDTSSYILDPRIFIDQKRIDKYFIVHK